MEYRILIVEDSKTQSLRTELLLNKAGHEVSCAFDGKEGLRLASMNHPDLIITDVNMPEMNGYQLCMRLKKSPKTHLIPVILLTSRDDLVDIAQGLKVGADGFLSKPFEVQALYQVIDKIMAAAPSTGRPEQVGEGRQNREQIMECILSTCSGHSNCDVIGVLLLSRSKDAGFLYLLSMFPLESHLIDQFIGRLLGDLQNHSGLLLSKNRLQTKVFVKEEELPPISKPFSLFMVLPLKMKGRMIGVLGAVSTANAITKEDVALFHNLCEKSAEAFGSLIGFNVEAPSP